MTDTELIEELFTRVNKSDVFCARVIKACKEFIKQLDEEE